MSTGEGESVVDTSYYKLMVYAAIIGAVASVVTAGYITLYNLGIKFLDSQPSSYLTLIMAADPLGYRQREFIVQLMYT